MADRELYEFAAATTDGPWAEAEACGWFNCPDVGGWLRPVPDGMVERMLAASQSPWPEEERPQMEVLLRAALGGDDG